MTQTMRGERERERNVRIKKNVHAVTVKQAACAIDDGKFTFNAVIIFQCLCGVHIPFRRSGAEHHTKHLRWLIIYVCMA